ncbi:hypothetical protein EDB81DRAFT_924210 [Dactylonectria macrodidyma]|uniref:N-acetyltransferase domain-containing protein n=1 Tax=Dactylonectria macrodidyma TaxID=307937 RepID=A0A9P9JGS2_9HYPO|nr:hypothetical protein EDB81DRAFT_924210 [Dactylonectria macrodidyma]
MAPKPKNPSVYPEAPSLGPLRIASAEDIMRMGVVYAAGFCDAEKNSWERRFHQKYPQSTILAHRHDVRDHLLRAEKVVLVATDKYDPDESSKTWANIPENNGWTPPKAGDDVIVGAVAWTLAESSNRLGQFQKHGHAFPILPNYNNEDLDKDRAFKVNSILDKEEEKIVVHPAYRKRGHGERLARWGLALAAKDKVEIGVVATYQGAALCKRVGFDLLHNVEIKDDDDKATGHRFSLLRYKTVGSA